MSDAFKKIESDRILQIVTKELGHTPRHGEDEEAVSWFLKGWAARDSEVRLLNEELMHDH